MVAVGKNMGTVEVWTSPPMHSASELSSAATQGRILTFTGAHGTLPVSSVCLRALAHPPFCLRLLSAGMNGHMKAWECSTSQVRAAHLGHVTDADSTGNTCLAL